MAKKEVTEPTPVVEGEDIGFFPTEGTVYANLPQSNEAVTAGPYNPTVRENTMNDDGTYEPSQGV